MQNLLVGLGMLGTALSLTGCALHAPAPDALPTRTNSGLVLGTVSCHFVAGLNQTHAPVPLALSFERLDAPGQDYRLLALIDPKTQRGFFSAPLPAGAYAYREAVAGRQRLEVGGLKMPFEVRPGEIQDLGHYSFNPSAVSFTQAYSSP